MPGSFEYFVWLMCTLFEVAVVVCAWKRDLLRKYALLSLYMGTSVLVSLVRFHVLNSYGYTSSQYVYVYFYSDALLTIFLYFALANLYAQVLGELKAERYVRFAALFLLAATALFSYGVVHGASTRLVTRFVVELSQNLYFVGLVLTYILWGAVLKLRETRTQLIHLVLSLGVYFSLFAADYALRNMYSSMISSIIISLQQVIGCFLPLAWAYAFWRVPAEARTMPSQLAAVPR